jgi:hexosaminidase
MKKRETILLIILLSLTVSALAQTTAPPTSAFGQHHLMPVPMSITLKPGKLAIDSSFRVGLRGFKDTRLEGAIERAIRRLAERTGLELPRGLAAEPSVATLQIECQGSGWATPALSEDESYTLNVTSGQAVLNARTVVGALRGLETFLQLLEGDGGGYFIPFTQIQDKPRFPWRGLLIDVCRHWEPIEVIKRNLDGMAAVKLNVLHLHLTENQGFRIESKRFPKLHQMGSDGLYYTQDQIREIIAYARDRGIRVIPEFDIPGHTTSWFVGYPELAGAPGPYEIERKYGVFDPAMDPTREETYKFLDKFLGEMAALFPDAYMHIGGDEVTGKQWRLNPQIQAFMEKKGLKDKQALQAYFNQRVSKILEKYGKKMVGWDEILHPDLPQSIVIQSWRGQKSLAEGARKGYSGILSSGYYLDHLRTTAEHYLIDPIRTDSGLTGEEAARILGGEACMWGEYVGPENIDSRIWPRLAAVAERLWSPREVTDVADMYRRLSYLSVQLEEFGLTHELYADRMLRRAAGTEHVEQLKTLMDVIEPIKDLRRERVRPITQLTPLTRLVDAARPDSETARSFALMVDAMLSDAPRFRANRDDMLHLLAEWRRVQPLLAVMADKSPIMNEAGPLAAQLSELSSAGAEAIEYLSSGAAPSDKWREEKLALVEAVAKSPSEVEFAILPAIKLLIVAAAEAPQLKTMTPAEWKAHVATLVAPAKK